MSLRFLSSSDIDRIKKSISQPLSSSENRSNDNQVVSKRDQLRKLSAARVAGWSDTLDSAREAKLKWKRDLLDREEEKRKEIDKQEAKIKAKLTANIIKRSQDLQYEEKEKVKFLRSQQLYTDVVETRKIQVEEKKERDRILLEEERKWHEESVKNAKAAEMKDKEKALQQKKKAIENAEVMRKQRIDIENQRKKILIDKRKEEELFINQAQAEISVMKENELQRKNHTRRKCKEEMQKLFSDIEIKKKAMERKEKEDEKRRQDDIARMTFIASARAKLELQHFEERQAVRKLLSDRAAEELKLRSNREVEIFIKEQKAQESKERAKKEEEERLKRARDKEMHESRQEQIRLRQQRKKQETDEENLILEKYKAMTLDEISREKRKENELRERHYQMRQCQLQQIKEKDKFRKDEKESKQLEAQKISDQLAKEDDLFKEFAMREMQRFKEAGKKTDLLNKALIS